MDACTKRINVSSLSPGTKPPEMSMSVTSRNDMIPIPMLLSPVVAAGVGGMAGSSIGRTPQGGIGDHKCHMCGQQFTLRQALITHIEEHKRSGLLMYFNLIDGKMTSTPTTQQVSLFLF